MSMQTTGFGAARRPPNTPCVPRQGMSAQLAPPALTPKDKKVMNSLCATSPQSERK